MSDVTPIDEFCQGRMALPELLNQIEKTFLIGDRSEQTALLDSWRKDDVKKQLDRRIVEVIDEKIETEYSKSRLGKLADDKTIVGPAPTALRPGYVLKGRFVLEEMLGSGGMGVVYRAVDLRKKEAQDRDPNIAIKVLNEDFRKHPDSVRALQREARKAQNLAHPNIITVYDFDRENDLIYLTMEYLSGASLEKKIKANRAPLPLAEVLSIVKPVSAALAFAHENAIVHSDLKPANIFITDSGRVKVIDFGIARAVKRLDQPDGAETTVFDAGQLRALTPAYASIEMIEGRDPDVRDDVYALGCITYELLAGRHPYGRMMATEARLAELSPKRPDGLTARQWRALLGTLSFDREGRTPSVIQFIEEFTAIEKASAWTPLRIGGGVATVVILGAGIYFMTANPFRAPAPVTNPPTADRSAPATPLKANAAIAPADHPTPDLVAKSDADRQAAEAAAKQEADRQAAEAAAKKEAEQHAAEAAAKKEADRQAAEAAAKKEAEQRAADAAAKKEADRQAADAAKKEAEQRAADAAAKKAAAQRAAAEATPTSTTPSPDANKLATALNPPRLSSSALFGAWCAGAVKIELTASQWRFRLADGSETNLAVTQYRVENDKILVYSTDNREHESVTEFGNFADTQMTQIRGRLVGADSWNNYNRIFKKC